MAGRPFLLQPKSSISLELIRKAVSEVRDATHTAESTKATRPKPRKDSTAKDTKVDVCTAANTKPEPYLDLLWTPSCEQIKDTYASQHYKKISVDSPESTVVNTSKVKKTGGKVFELLGGQRFAFPSGSAYVAILLAMTGRATVEVKAPGDRLTPVSWEVGSLLYLTGDCSLACVGDGTVLCIILAMSYGDE